MFLSRALLIYEQNFAVHNFFTARETKAIEIRFFITQRSTTSSSVFVSLKFDEFFGTLCHLQILKFELNPDMEMLTNLLRNFWVMTITSVQFATSSSRFTASQISAVNDEPLSCIIMLITSSNFQSIIHTLVLASETNGVCNQQKWLDERSTNSTDHFSEVHPNEISLNLNGWVVLSEVLLGSKQNRLLMSFNEVFSFTAPSTVAEFYCFSDNVSSFILSVNRAFSYN